MLFLSSLDMLGFDEKFSVVRETAAPHLVVMNTKETGGPLLNIKSRILSL